jgi:hypothetical protein
MKNVGQTVAFCRLSSLVQETGQTTKNDGLPYFEHA